MVSWSPTSVHCWPVSAVFTLQSMERFLPSQSTLRSQAPPHVERDETEQCSSTREEGNSLDEVSEKLLQWKRPARVVRVPDEVIWHLEEKIIAHRRWAVLTMSTLDWAQVCWNFEAIWRSAERGMISRCLNRCCSLIVNQLDHFIAHYKHVRGDKDVMASSELLKSRLSVPVHALERAISSVTESTWQFVRKPTKKRLMPTH